MDATRLRTQTALWRTEERVAGEENVNTRLGYCR